MPPLTTSAVKAPINVSLTQKYLPHSTELSQRNKYLFVAEPEDPQCGQRRSESTVAIPAPISRNETNDSTEHDCATIDDNFSSTRQSHNRLLFELVLLIWTQNDRGRSHRRHKEILDQNIIII